MTVALQQWDASKYISELENVLFKRTYWICTLKQELECNFENYIIKTHSLQNSSYYRYWKKTWGLCSFFSYIDIPTELKIIKYIVLKLVQTLKYILKYILKQKCLQ